MRKNAEIKKLLHILEVGVVVFLIIFILDKFNSIPSQLKGVEYWGTLSGILIKYYQENQTEKKQEEGQYKESTKQLIEAVAKLKLKLVALDEEVDLKHDHLKEQIQGDIERISAMLDFLDIKELMPIILSMVSLRDQTMKHIVILPEDIAKRFEKESERQKILIRLLRARYKISGETSNIEYEDSFEDIEEDTTIEFVEDDNYDDSEMRFIFGKSKKISDN